MAIGSRWARNACGRTACLPSGYTVRASWKIRYSAESQLQRRLMPLQRVITPGWTRELDRALTPRNQPLQPQAQLVILLNGRPFFNLIEGEGRSSAIRREQVEHRSGLFEPQAVRIGIFLIDVLVEHGVVFHR
jgi:hypothetical protein